MFTSLFHLPRRSFILLSRLVSSASARDMTVCLVITIPWFLSMEACSFFLCESISSQKLWYSSFIAFSLLSAEVSISLFLFWAKDNFLSISFVAAEVLPDLSCAISSDNFNTSVFSDSLLAFQSVAKSFSSSSGRAFLSSAILTGILSISFLISLILKPLCLRYAVMSSCVSAFRRSAKRSSLSAISSFVMLPTISDRKALCSFHGRDVKK